MHRFLLSPLLVVALVGCSPTSSDDTSGGDPASSSGLSDRADSPPGEGITISNKQLSEAWNSGGEDLEGASVDVAGRVYQDQGDALLIYGDPKEDELPLQVSGPFAGVDEDDYVRVQGTLKGSDTYESVGGGDVDVLTIDGESVRRISRERALATVDPAAARRSLNLSQTRGGLTVTLKAIAWTAGATRLRVSVTNGGRDDASISAFDAKIQQGSQQFDIADDDESADDLSDDLNPGVTVTKTLTFEKISRQRGKGYIKFDWLSDNYDLDTDKPFEFTMRWRP
jgi:hypothetical protein